MLTCFNDERKPVIVCGDLNVAHQEIDLKNAKSNHGNSGFTLEERGKMTDLLAAGFIDSFRHFYPDRTDVYSWWSYMAKVRAEYRLAHRLFSGVCPFNRKLKDAEIDCHVMGSDHCPVSLTLSESLR